MTMFQKKFNIFTPMNVFESTCPSETCSGESLSKSGTFGFTCLMDVSPAEVAYLATCSLTEKLLFSISRWDRQFVDFMSDSVVEALSSETDCSRERRKIGAVTRMLLVPSRSEIACLRRKLATGLCESPFEALVYSHEDRISCSAKVLRSVFSFIPRARAAPVFNYTID